MTNNHDNDLMDDAMTSYLYQQRKIDEVITLVHDIKKFITDSSVEDEWDNEDLVTIHEWFRKARKLLKDIDRCYPTPEGEQ